MIKVFQVKVVDKQSLFNYRSHGPYLPLLFKSDRIPAAVRLVADSIDHG